MSGRFIVFEGGDGSGKSTQVAALVRWLDSRGITPVVTRQPGGTPLGSQLRRLVLDPASAQIAARAEALIYAADKAQHVDQVLRPALDAGRIVVCDRYIDSMIAYQGAGRILEVEDVTAVAAWATGGLLPDLTILLDAEPRDTVMQITSKDRLEDAGLDFHQRVRAHFLELATSDPSRYLVLPARDTRESISQAVAQRVAQLLSQ